MPGTIHLSHRISDWSLRLERSVPPSRMLSTERRARAPARRALAILAVLASAGVYGQDCQIILPKECKEVETRVSMDIPPWTVPTTKTYKFGSDVFFVRSHRFTLTTSERFPKKRLADGQVIVYSVKEFDCPERAVRHADLATGKTLFFSCEPAIAFNVKWPGGIEARTVSREIFLARQPRAMLHQPGRFVMGFERPLSPQEDRGIAVERFPLGTQDGASAEDSWTAAYCRVVRLEQKHQCEVDARDREIYELREQIKTLTTSGTR
jgi:hypothetical protein